MVRTLATLVGYPSVSERPEGVEALAEHLRAAFEQRGFEVHDVAAGGPPLLLAIGGNAKAESTIMFYAHYDGQNVDASDWKACEPFEPSLLTGPPGSAGVERVGLDHGDMQPDWRLCGRGAADDKGPIAVMLAVFEGIEALRLDPLPVRVKILLDGEEESGSPHLGAALADPQHRELLAADVVVSLDGPVYPTGAATMTYGVRGILGLELTTFGATAALHSGHYGNWAPNPALELSWVLASIKDPFSGEVKIDGFYDCRAPLGPLERESLARIPGVEAQLRDRWAIGRVEPQWPLNEAVTYPSFNVRGIRAGAVGAEATTSIPDLATAAVDIRLVEGCTGDRMFALLREHLSGLGYHVVSEAPTEAERRRHPRLIQLVLHPGGYDAVRTPLDAPVARHMRAAVARVAGEELVELPTMGGSLPFYLFEQHLGIPLVALPLVNHDNNQHAADENVRLGNLWRGFDILAAVVLTYGTL